MKLIPGRKKSPTTFERVTGFVKLGVKGLVVQRAARRLLKTYKFTRRAVPLVGLAVIAAVVAKKMRGGDAPGTPSYSPPPSTTASAGPSVAAAATAATGTPPVNGDVSSAPDVPEAPAAESTKEAAAPGVGDEQTGGGGDDATSDTAYESAEKGETPTTPELEVEGPNESTPPPPEKTKK